VADEQMQRFWDERAKENAMYFVDSRLDYNDTDEERFWSDGRDTLAAVLDIVGAKIEPGDHVVDVGCGVGRLSRAAAKTAAKVTGVDVSEEMVRQARELNAHLDNVEFLHGDGRHLNGVEDGSADALVSHVVFQHIPDPKITLGYVAEMGRVLRPGGWAAFQISNDPSIHRAKPTGLAGAVRRLLGREPKGRSNAAWLGSAVDLADLRATADAAGLDVERVEGEGTQFCFVLLRRR
jgi:SAM-dependent methyltransferase